MAPENAIWVPQEWLGSNFIVSLETTKRDVEIATYKLLQIEP